MSGNLNLQNLIDNIVNTESSYFTNRRNHVKLLAKRNQKFLLIIIFLMIIIASLDGFRRTNNLELILIAGVFKALIIIFVYLTTNKYSLLPAGILKNLKSQYKSKVIEKAVYGIDSNLIFNANHLTNESYFQKSGFFNSYISDKYEDDYISGKYKDIGFHIVDVHIQEFLRFIFNGLFIIIKFENYLDNEFMIIDKKDKKKKKQAELRGYKLLKDNELFLFYSKTDKYNQVLFSQFSTLISDFNRNNNSCIGVSLIDQYLFIGIDFAKDDLFELKLNDKTEISERIKYDITLLNNALAFVYASIDFGIANNKSMA